MNLFPSSELILNSDGSVYHLHLLPGDVAEHIITVGDPERVEMIAKYFEKIRVKKRNREFYTITGSYKNKEITVISTGIGTDNIDIVFNELAVLARIDLVKKTYLTEPIKYKIIRIGTSGTLREDVSLGTLMISEYATGLEGLMNFYPTEYTELEKCLNIEIENCLKDKFSFLKPYVIGSSQLLVNAFEDVCIKGFTATCQGFYHPQGRFLWSTNNASILEQLRAVNYHGKVITNFEMETAGILGLSRFFGFEASSISLILANRITNEFIENAESKMEEAIEICLNKILSI